LKGDPERIAFLFVSMIELSQLVSQANLPRINADERESKTGIFS
jgi:hypothetical protein